MEIYNNVFAEEARRKNPMHCNHRSQIDKSVRNRWEEKVGQRSVVAGFTNATQCTRDTTCVPEKSLEFPGY